MKNAHVKKHMNYSLILTSMLIAVLMVNIEYSGIGIIFPEITKALNLTLLQVGWCATLYLLTNWASDLAFHENKITLVKNSEHVGISADFLKSQE
jgi:hypothetical protein